MDRWKVSDLEALALVGHPGGLTKKGTRPRFRLTGEEAEVFGYLKEIDATLATLGAEPAEWMRQPVREAPFKGATPLAHIARQRQDGARDVIRKLMLVGLQQTTQL
jgi:hypothetical protein